MVDRRRVVAGGLATALIGPAYAQQKSEIAISRQPGILYMPTHVIERRNLLEKHAAKLGLQGTTVKWLSFSNGGAQQDALLAGAVDFVNTGTGNMLLLWDRTKGGVKGVVASSAQPLLLVSRDERIKTLKDFGASDKIAVPTVKVSTQAILLQMAASALYGADQFARFDPQTVQMGHPDAYVAMKNPQHEVHSHFGAPPFQNYELKNVPGAHLIASSVDIIGGPLTQGQFFTTTKFADANPKIIDALRAAAVEAKALIESDTASCVEDYREVTGDKTAAADLLALLKEPGMMEWNLYPQGTMKFAAHLNKTGPLKTMPASFRDYYLPGAHDMPGS